jgi:hypothetical protein
MRDIFFKLMEQNELSGDELSEMEQGEVVERVNSGDLHELNSQNLQSVLDNTIESNTLAERFQLKPFRIVLKRFDLSKLRANKSGNLAMKSSKTLDNENSSDSDSMRSLDLNSFNLRSKTNRLQSTDSSASLSLNSTARMLEKVPIDRDSKSLDFFLNSNINESNEKAASVDGLKKKFFDLINKCSLEEVLSDDDTANSSKESCLSDFITNKKKLKYISKKKRSTRLNSRSKGISFIVRNADVLSTDDEQDHRKGHKPDGDAERDNYSNDAPNSNESSKDGSSEQNQATSDADNETNEEEGVRVVSQTFRISSDVEILEMRRCLSYNNYNVFL